MLGCAGCFARMRIPSIGVWHSFMPGHGDATALQPTVSSQQLSRALLPVSDGPGADGGRWRQMGDVDEQRALRCNCYGTCAVLPPAPPPSLFLFPPRDDAPAHALPLLSFDASGRPFFVLSVQLAAPPFSPSRLSFHTHARHALFFLPRRPLRPRRLPRSVPRPFRVLFTNGG